MNKQTHFLVNFRIRRASDDYMETDTQAFNSA